MYIPETIWQPLAHPITPQEFIEKFGPCSSKHLSQRLGWTEQGAARALKRLKEKGEINGYYKHDVSGHMVMFYCHKKMTHTNVSMINYETQRKSIFTLIQKQGPLSASIIAVKLGLNVKNTRTSLSTLRLQKKIEGIWATHANGVNRMLNYSVMK